MKNSWQIHDNSCLKKTNTNTMKYEERICIKTGFGSGILPNYHFTQDYFDTNYH